MVNYRPHLGYCTCEGGEQELGLQSDEPDAVSLEHVVHQPRALQVVLRVTSKNVERDIISMA